MASTVVSQLKKLLSVSKGKTIEEVLKTFNDSGGSIGGKGPYFIECQMTPDEDDQSMYRFQSNTTWTEIIEEVFDTSTGDIVRPIYINARGSLAGEEARVLMPYVGIAYGTFRFGATVGSTFLYADAEMPESLTKPFTATGHVVPSPDPDLIHRIADAVDGATHIAENAQETANNAESAASAAQTVIAELQDVLSFSVLAPAASIDLAENKIRLRNGWSFEVFLNFMHEEGDHRHPVKLMIAGPFPGREIEMLLIMDIDGAIATNDGITVYGHSNIFVDTSSGAVLQNLFYMSGSGAASDPFFLNMPSLS